MGLSTTSAEATLDALTDPVLVFGTDGRLCYVNSSAVSLLGESNEALVGRSGDELVPERLRRVGELSFLNWLVQSHQEHGRPIRAPLRRSDGVEIHQSFHLSTTTIEGVGVSVVALLRSPDDALDVVADPLMLDVEHPPKERSYEAVFEAVPVGVIHFDARGRITNCNQNLVEQLGSSRAVLTGLDMLTLPNLGVREAVRDALSGRDGHFDGEYVSVTGGRRRMFRALFSPIVRDDQVVGGVGIVDDVTERYEIEARLAHGDRMASLGRLAAGVAHEINNPLAYVRTSLDIARRDLERVKSTGEALDVDRVLETLAHADDGIERVRIIASDLKTFSRGDEGSWMPVDLASVVSSAINLANHEIRHRAQLVREIQPVPPVMGSETRYVQVLVNLLVNAAQAIEERDAPQHRVTLRVGSVREGRVFIEVEDTGAGMPEDRIPHIFEPFWTSKPKATGTGLGLAICHGIIHAAGGEIYVARSELGVGSTFRIELPAAPAVDPSLATRPVPEPPSAVLVDGRRRARVLIIDDEPQLGTTLRLALGDRYEVIVAQSGRTALDELSHSGEFDLILCDLMMPGLSGIDLYEELRATRPDVAERIVFMSGGAFTDRARRFLKERGLRPLEKPFSLSEVERLMDERI